LHVIKILNDHGEAKSLIPLPATTTHQRLTQEARATLGITDGMLRLSVGLQDAEDLIEDLPIGLATAGR
jgi:O-succinylhomoserine sulfhydrylase